MNYQINKYLQYNINTRSLCVVVIPAINENMGSFYKTHTTSITIEKKRKYALIKPLNYINKLT